MITRSLVSSDEKIQSDCTLSLEDVVPSLDEFDVTREETKFRRRTIVLTGATGFVGPFLLQEFLNRKEYHVVCLVRAESDVRARERVLKNLEKYEIKIKNLTNLQVLRFTLTKGNLGLDENVYKNLISRITDVHHLAARVNFSDPYDTLREANVLGVVHMIRLCCRAQNAQRLPVRFHYYSTTDVLPFRTDAWTERLPTSELMPIPRGGYPQTKYVGEILLSRIHTQGLQCTIHRLCMIGPAFSNGATNPTDFVARMLRGLERMRVVPRSTGDYVHMIPVDVCARVAVAVGESFKSIGMAFNYDGRCSSSTRERLDFETLVSGVRKYLGVDKMRECSYDTWCEEIHIDETNPLHSIWNRDSRSFPKFDRKVVYSVESHEIVCDALGL